ncbi:MAG: tyrosine-type recombinase/integrase [Desulfovibrio aminophilus]|uniref:tyrosine-type recombinase/integrase n=1 Tax=Desulfovibrio aminophilus TaxID=81425 RepID=UPI0039EA73D9
MLTDTAIRNAKPGQKQRKLSDEKGLFLLVAPSGGKWWRFKYRFAGKEKLLSLGTYPEVSLAQARERRDEARKLLARGIDPSAARKAEKRSGDDTFERIALEWYSRTRPRWGQTAATQILAQLKQNVFPWIGSRPIREINAEELLTAMRRIEERGAIYTAHRALQTCGRVFRYALACNKVDRDPTITLRGTLTSVKEKHRACILDPRTLGKLLRDIDGYQGTFVVRAALKLAPLLFVRPGELRHAEWPEVDLEAAEWRIPAAKMKMEDLHIVPLSRQAVAVLRELHPLTGKGKYVFPGFRSPARPMSENTVNAALRYMGYSAEQVTGHGFRATAMSLLNEQGWNRDAVDRQLAHAERNKVRAAYLHAEFLPERRRMMQAWADFLDGLRQGGKVIPIRAASGE